MTPRLFTATFVLSLLIGFPAAMAFAQVVADDPTQSSGGLQITPIKEGWLAGPEVRLTSINNRAATLAGGYGGYEVDHTLLVGGAAYWLVNRQNDFEAQYGGALVRWAIGGDRAVAVSPGVLIGMGTATLARTYADIYGNRFQSTALIDSRGRSFSPPPPSPPNGSTPVLVRDAFSIAEPQANALIRLTPRARLDAGVGYRFIGMSPLLQNQLKGVSGSLALRFSY
jgi:hypothetical protein